MSNIVPILKCGITLQELHDWIANKLGPIRSIFNMPPVIKKKNDDGKDGTKVKDNHSNL